MSNHVADLRSCMLLQFTMFIVTTVFGVIRGALSKKDDGNSRRRDDDEWD